MTYEAEAMRMKAFMLELSNKRLHDMTFNISNVISSLVDENQKLKLDLETANAELDKRRLEDLFPLEKLLEERLLLRANLKNTQERSTKLIEENRELKRKSFNHESSESLLVDKICALEATIKTLMRNQGT
jgi:hypothetical protein